MKYTRGFYLLISIYSLISTQSVAQVVDTLILPEMVVEAERFALESTFASSDIKRIVLTKADRVGSLQTVLQRKSSLFVRDQGSGLLSLLSYNGFGPHQTKIEWNGMEINHPMIGMVDFAIIPSSFISQIEYGTSNSIANPGAMALGGVLSLMSFNNVIPIQVNTQYGAYGHKSLGFASAIQTEGARTNVLFSYSSGNYDFPYQDRVFNRTARRNHNEKEEIGLQIGYVGQVFSKPLESTIWLQQNDRNIPGAIGTTQSNSKEIDAWVRVSNKIKLEDGAYPWLLNLNFSVDKLDYSDSLLARFDSEFSKSTTYKTQIRTSKRLFFNELVWSDFTFEQYVLWTKTNYFDADPSRIVHRGISHGVWKPFFRLTINPIIQLEYFSDFGLALSPSIGATIELIQNTFYVFSSLNKSFTPPTLNALYWPELGDPNLKAEQAVKWESGYRFFGKTERLTWSQTTSYMFANVENGIEWIPLNSLWKPQNIIRSEHHAITISGELNYSSKVFSWFNSLVFNTTDAHISKDRVDPILASRKGKQLRYVPDASIKYSTQLSYKQSSIELSMQRIGNRFIDASNSNWLDPYTILDLNVGHQFQFKTFSLYTGIQINNVLNERFEVIKNYPQMPRNLLLTFQIQLNK